MYIHVFSFSTYVCILIGHVNGIQICVYMCIYALDRSMYLAYVHMYTCIGPRAKGYVGFRPSRVGMGDGSRDQGLAGFRARM